ncbi:MAG: tRNA (guanosine(46)-N7)-methyltransferase TrmB, partial [Desulfuromonadales bacterium GWD2_61_12]
MTQRVIPIESPRFVQPAEFAAAANLADLFPDNRPLALEIGCGIGDFMVQLAARHPAINFLAIDIYNQGCLKTCRRLDAAGLANVRVMRIEARQLLVEGGGRQSLEAVYINCPDPWPKKRHRGRRLLNAAFLQMLLYFLKPQGELFFATDFSDYA